MNLALSGAIFQAVTRNELASPYILGVSSGAGLAVLLTLAIFGGLAAYMPLFAALGVRSRSSSSTRSPGTAVRVRAGSSWRA